MAVAVAVVDDDNVQNEYLVKLVKQWADDRGIVADVRSYGSAEAFFFDYEDMPCSLLLLDIEMQGQNGMERQESSARRGTDCRLYLSRALRII